ERYDHRQGQQRRKPALHPDEPGIITEHVGAALSVKEEKLLGMPYAFKCIGNLSLGKLRVLLLELREKASRLHTSRDEHQAADDEPGEPDDEAHTMLRLAVTGPRAAATLEVALIFDIRVHRWCV